MTISFVSVVKNEDKVLRRCLESVKPIIDEWIIVDTGSTDDTASIIMEYAGVLRTLPFEDYVTTKNKALRMATGDYVLYMDADEYVLQGLDKLRAHAEGGADCVVARIVEGSDTVVTQSYYRCRLWRNHGQFEFSGPGVHETILPAGNVVSDGDILVRHDHAHRTPESYHEKFVIYRRILEAWLVEHPDDARAVFYLARTLKDLNLPLLAIGQYERYLNMQTAFKDERWQAAHDIALCYKSLGEYDSALKACLRATEIDGRRAETFVLAGSIHLQEQHWANAARNYQRALSLPIPHDVILFLSPRDYHAVPLEGLAICLDRLKDYRGAREICEQVRRETAGVSQNVVNNLAWLNVKMHLKLFFALGHTPEPVHGGMIDEIGVGGVETTYIELPTELARLGHDVFVFCRCDREHVKDGVRYIPYASMPDYARLDADVVVTSRWFDSMYVPGTAHSKKIIWLQDSHFADPNHADAWGVADAVVVSSPWHRSYTAERIGHAIRGDKMNVIPLGIRKALFNRSVPRDPRQVIYSSNPDRGLYILRDMWTELCQRVPGLHLVITYGWEGLKTWGNDPAWVERIENDRRVMLEWAAQAGNVQFTGRLKKSDLAMAMLQSSVCLYPNNFQETFCLTALEAQAAGVPMVTTRLGALATTLQNDCNVLIPFDPYSAEYRKQFIDSAVELLLNDRKRADYSRACLEHVARGEFDWTDIARQWEALIFRIL